jgi:hypothetical protein
MTEVLTDLFVKAGASQIDWEGEPIYAIFEIASAPENIDLEFIEASAAPVQGFVLKVSGGALVVNEVEASQMVLWHDTAPRLVHLQVKWRAGKRRAIKLWNVWRARLNDSDVTQAWLGNAGMRIHSSSDGKELLIGCSDGVGQVNFGDLKLRITIAS